MSQNIKSIKEYSPQIVEDDAFLAPLSEVKEILSDIRETLVMEKGYEWNLEEYFSILDYLTLEHETKFAWIIVREGREIKRIDSEGHFENSPDTPKGSKGELSVARSVAIDHPAVMLIKQNGSTEKGWRGTPFWWPVLLTQKNTESTIYAKDTI